MYLHLNTRLPIMPPAASITTENLRGGVEREKMELVYIDSWGRQWRCYISIAGGEK